MATTRAIKVFGSNSVDVERVVRRALLGQSKVLDSESSQAEVDRAASDKNSLLELVANGSISPTLACKLQFAVQALDDVTDLIIDARKGMRTTICLPYYEKLDEADILADVANSGSLESLLVRIGKNLAELSSEIRAGVSASVPIMKFLDFVMSAVEDLRNATENLRQANDEVAVRVATFEISRKIKIYAIGS